MKILFCGLGSMGSRHLKNMAAILHEEDAVEFHALRSSKRTLALEVGEKISREFSSWDEVDENYDVIFITNPTAKHYETLVKALPHARKIFLEKPVFQDTVEDLTTLNITSEHIIYVAAPLRYTKIISYLREYLRERKVLGVRAICSSYLPEWRPGTDWRQCYSARAELGGGVDLDLIHEWDYLAYLFGLPQKSFAIRSRRSDITVDSCDSAVYIAAYPSMNVSLHLDYFGRVARRELEIYLEDDVLCADFIKGKISWLKSGKIFSAVTERDEMQRAELKYFLSLRSEADNENSVEHAVQVLKLAKGEW